MAVQRVTKKHVGRYVTVRATYAFWSVERRVYINHISPNGNVEAMGGYGMMFALNRWDYEVIKDHGRD